jgi:hypothetical protein
VDYSILFDQTFKQHGFDVVGVWNTFDPPYDPVAGWPLKLPSVEFGPNTLLAMHFQDFVTFDNGRIVELDRVADHYGQYAKQIVVMHMHHDLSSVYHGPINLIEFSYCNYDLMRLLRNEQHKWQHIVDQAKTKSWQSLNGRTCPHRRRVADVLQHMPNGVLSYGNEIPLPKWSYATYPGTENHDNFYRLAEVYGSCAVNIVTETLYNDYPGLFCEKTLLAMVAQQIPIIIGYRGIVQHLRDIGFDMFDDLVDHSYDLLPNDVRAEQAIMLNQKFIVNPGNLESVQARLIAQRIFVLETLPAWYRSNFQQCAKELADRLLS